MKQNNNATQQQINKTQIYPAIISILTDILLFILMFLLLNINLNAKYSVAKLDYEFAFEICNYFKR